MDWLKVVKIILTEIPTNQYTSEACGNSEKANLHPQQIFVAPFKVNTNTPSFCVSHGFFKATKNPWNIKVPSKRSFLLINPWIPTHFWSEIQALKPTQSWSLKSAKNTLEGKCPTSKGMNDNRSFPKNMWKKVGFEYHQHGGSNNK